MKKTLLLIVAAVTLICFPKTNFGQVISLGPDASKFVLFTSSGAVSDNASAHSHITGDVGSVTAGPIPGFGNVNGVMHPGADASTTACGIDLAATIAQINANPATLFPSGTMGSGVVFIPGIYNIPGNATLTLDLILDGQGNSNAEFVIKIQGTFSTNTNARVKLINGAKACHVFWKIDGAVSMASNSTMRGNIISGGAVNMGSGDSLEGRLFITPAGAITIDGITAFTPIGCGSLNLTGPHSPPMGTAACYTIFASTGALNGNLSSTSIGDVGSNGGGTVTGWTAGNVTGALHITQDPSTIQAAIDVLNLYDTLNAMVPDIELLYPVQFGANLVLTPHVYLMNSGGAFGPATLTDTVYLDAQGNANGVFVIKIISGAFTTSTYANVVLINGAQAKNVYWMVDGAVSINNYSKFRGTIVVSAGAINLVNTGVILDGRALTVNGAITTAGLAAAMPPGCGVIACAPVITTEPLNKTVCVGGSVSFTVVASGIGNTYQWRKGNTAILGATNDTLTIDPVNMSDAALNYNVIVSGTCPPDDTSNFVRLTVNAAPIITNQPVNKTACVGDSISFTVAASGTNLTYQWRKGNSPILGATNDTLTINPVTLIDAALNYNVIVSGVCPPKDTSIFVSLTVNALPNITNQPVSHTVCAGDSVSFTVVATGNGLTYQWRKGNVNLVNLGNISGITTSTLTINPANVFNAANNYNVIVSGVCLPKDTSVNVSLTVNASPIITTQPTNQSVCIGDSVSFKVIATGNGLTYQWRKGNVNLINSGNISGVTTSTLTINPAGVINAANNYNVIVSGVCPPKDTSVNVTLTVSDSTFIITPPVSQTICAGDSVSFFVVASGGNLTYQWRKGIVNLVNGGNISGATSDTLTINPATILDIANNYNVVISGSCTSFNTLNNSLDSAGGFGILAGTAITSTGFSVINNVNVGLSPGVRSSITGFPPATVVNGAIYASDDVAPPGVAAMLTQAKLDLTNAYLFAEGATAPAPATVAGDQGGKTLAPGIYKSTSTLLIQSGDLTLDAQGDVNAVWIFQIASDFTTIGGAGGNVILTGGAQAKNITWQVGSSATIGNGTSFKGNILALTSITMNTTATIDGRLLARNGAVVLSGANIINRPSDTVTTSSNSTTTINVSLAVNTAPVITNQPSNQTVCAGNSVSLTVQATGTGLTYQWRKGIVNMVNSGTVSGATTSTLTINPASVTDAAVNYNVIVSGACLPKDTSINISLIVHPVYSINNPQAICNGGTYVINGHTYSTTGVYHDTLTSMYGCDSVIVTQLTVHPVYTTNNPQTICDGNSYVFNSHIYTTAGTYTDILSTMNGCDSTIITLLTVTPLPIAVANSNSPICSGSSIDLTATTVTGGTYLWSGINEYSSTLQNPVIPNSNVAESGIYTLIVTANGCASLPVDVTIIVNDCIADLSVVKTVSEIHPFMGHTVVFTIIATNNGPFDATGVTVAEMLQSGFTFVSSTATAGTYDALTGVWTIGNMLVGASETLTITATVNLTGEYGNTATITGNEIDNNLVNNVSAVMLIPTDFFIPEGYSPNGDAINDFFVIRGLENYPGNSIVIYNRWGNKVFEAQPYLNNWDGKCTLGISFGGDQLPVGTYFYLLDLGNGSDVIKGNVYLTR